MFFFPVRIHSKLSNMDTLLVVRAKDGLEKISPIVVNTNVAHDEAEEEDRYCVCLVSCVC